MNPSVLVITDDVGPLAIAGIKGGNRAEVDANTKNIILESANFDPVNIRKTSAKIGIRTEASKRYENELTQELALPAMDTLTELLSESAVVAGTKIGAKIDIYPTPAIGCQIKIRPAEISSILGVSVPEEAMIDILERLDIKVEKNGDGLNLEIPFRRIDLAVKENIMEEVGRIYGYDKIGSQLLDLKANKLADPVLEKKMRVADKIKEILVGVGFSEIYGYALVAKGDIELESPFASDKGFLRNNLADFINDRLAFNLPNNLFDNEPVKIFEIGQVFAGGGERASLCFGIAYKKQKKIKAEEVREEVSQVGANILRVLAADDFVWDVNISELPAYGQDCLLATVEVSLNELISRAGEFVSPDLTPFIGGLGAGGSKRGGGNDGYKK
ncbi:MAG: phenylalanine--tRNA ligase beta subunit-related protein [Candidatus Vogelbacteria bacterium]|nr:phenylalanine--tRNA ligase beta subunit-related protein [Candidatus Vogelbacteria bacterium]